MNGDIQAAAKLLAELRDVYRELPRHLQVDVRHVLREYALQKQQATRGRAELVPAEVVRNPAGVQFRNS